MQFTDRDWCTRIGTKDGVGWLTVPVSARSRSKRISELVLESPAWQVERARLLRETYRGAPHFAQLEGIVATLREGRA